MKDLFREGLKLGESLARFPWQVARRVTRRLGKGAQQAVDLGERVGTAPFRLALRTSEHGGTDPKTRIVVLGAGYAGLSCYLELQDGLSPRYDVVLVNADRYHWFTTELHTYAAGEPEDAVRIPLSRVIAPPGRLSLGRVERIDLPAQRVLLEGGGEVSYDYLVFALGSDPEYFNLPGVQDHSMIVGNWQGATKLRYAVAEVLATRENPHIVIAGGGLTGVEVAGELADEYPGRARLTLVEAGPEIMAGFASDLVEISRTVLEGHGITIRTGNPIASVTAREIHFKDGDLLPFDLLVWAGGVRGSAILGLSGFEVTTKGRGKVDRYLRALGHDTIYLVGDSAALIDPKTEREVLPTAQAAVQMGQAAGRNIVRRLKGQPEQIFVPRIRGAFASLGRQQGVGQIGSEQFSGLPAMVVKNLIEAHHAWETGAGAMPLVKRLLSAPRRYLRRSAGQPQR